MSGQSNGVIHSPNYPEKYATSTEGLSVQCHWFLHASPGHNILLYFEDFEVEGKPNGELTYFYIIIETYIQNAQWPVEFRVNIQRKFI